VFTPEFMHFNLNYRLGSKGHSYSRFKEAKNVESVDLLILGSSHALRGFDPRIFAEAGFTTFNLGSSSQTPIQTLTILHRYLDKINPSFVIYEVYPETFEKDGVESALDIIANDRNDYHSLLMSLKVNHIKVYNTLMYAVMRDALKMNTSFNEPEIKKKEKDRYIPGGYVEREIEYFKPYLQPVHTIDVKNQQLNAFNQILSILRDKKINFFLVYAPITKSNYLSYSNSAEYDSLMNISGNYFNFNELLDLNDSIHFYDGDHLNQLGVNIFNKSLIEILFDKKVMENN
jgi:hypothetical protein